MGFGERLLSIRRKNGLTQLDMSQALRISQSYIALLEKNKKEPSNVLISMICNEFSVNESWLRTGEGEPFFDASGAMQKAFASYFIQISKAFAPVYSAYGEILPLFENQEITRIYNYIALRVKKGGLNQKNLSALAQSFDLAFPGYADVIKSLEAQSFLVSKGMESSRVAQDTFMPVSGLAAAGAPLYEESDGSESVSVPQHYCNDRFFVVQAEGDSMEPDIMDGDYVVVQRSLRPENGEIALVRVDGKAIEEYTIKCFYDHMLEIELRSRNTAYQPMFYPITHVISAEKVVHIIHK